MHLCRNVLKVIAYLVRILCPSVIPGYVTDSMQIYILVLEIYAHDAPALDTMGMVLWFNREESTDTIKKNSQLTI